MRNRQHTQAHPGEATVGKTENFLTRNVRLITFLVCIGVFLALFLPIATMETRDYFHTEKDKRPQMTLDDLLRLCEEGTEITRAQIAAFACTEQKKSDATYYYVEIEPDYLLLAVADTGTGSLIYCQLADLKNDRKVDVLTEDVRAFLAGD